MKNKYYDKQGVIIILSVILAILLFILCSCSATKSMQKTVNSQVKTEYIYKTDTLLKRDTISRFDSVFVKLKGDTTYIERWHTLYKVKYEYKNRVDTVCRTDTITKVEYGEKIVEKGMSFWQKVKNCLIGTIIGCIITVLVLFLAKLKR